MFTVGVLTVSDKGSRGERLDESGRVVAELVAAVGGQVTEYALIPDDRETIAGKLRQWADETRLAVVLTTGGTGFAPRDITPEATLSVLERQAPGLSEAMRAAGGQRNPRAMLSRAIAGIRGQTIIVNLPGSPRGVRESLAVLLPVLPHAVEILTGKPTDHA